MQLLIYAFFVIFYEVTLYAETIDSVLQKNRNAKNIYDKGIGSILIYLNNSQTLSKIFDYNFAAIHQKDVVTVLNDTVIPRSIPALTRISVIFKYELNGISKVKIEEIYPNRKPYFISGNGHNKFDDVFSIYDMYPSDGHIGKKGQKEIVINILQTKFYMDAPNHQNAMDAEKAAFFFLFSDRFKNSLSDEILNIDVTQIKQISILVSNLFSPCMDCQKFLRTIYIQTGEKLNIFIKANEEYRAERQTIGVQKIEKIQ